MLFYLARGGGGGSGGGGGGSGGGGGGSFSHGGSGSGGDTDPSIYLLVIGFIVYTYARKYLRARFKESTSRILALLAGVTLAILSVAGLKASGILAFIGVIVAFAFDITGLASKFGATITQTTKRLKEAANKDSAWDEAKLREVVTTIFMKYQADWSNFNLDSMKAYLDKDYFEHMRLVLTDLRNLRRRNYVQDPTLTNISFIAVDDEIDNNQDSFVALIGARAKDQLFDVVDDKLLYIDKNPWQESWYFRRQGKNWLLYNIRQTTESNDVATQDLKQFAQDNKFFYNADFGWLLLPKRGQLFAQADFVNSDVNNHVIGLYRNVLVEFYSYLPHRQKQEYYMIAQTVLPKTYGNIVVRHKHGLWQRDIRGLNKLSSEANAFNSKYEIFADDVEQVSAFELLHPVYMEKLIALDYEISIEVIDQVLYLYSTDRNVDYNSMLTLLKAAFEEMKM